MPDMTFHCTYALNYTEGRDSAGHHLGLVEPGDIRDLDRAPDQHWHETTDEDRAALAAREAAVPDAQEAAAEGDGQGGGDETGGEPPADPETPPEADPQDVPPGM
jgi:hypothetical protein